jgi:endonuclease/exonuclease/phosphatase family metal-dependent hydrolase
MSPHAPHRALFLAALFAGAPVLCLLVWPQAFAVQTATPFAQLIAFRVPLAIALLCVTVIALLTALLGRRAGLSAGIGAIACLALVVDVGVVLSRGTDGSDASADLTVLAWNTQGGAVTPATIAAVVAAAGADVVSLPETDADAARDVVRLLDAEGIRMAADTVHADDARVDIPTSVLIADRLGRYVLDTSAGSTPGLPSGVWRPVSGEGPVIVAAHPMPPLPSTLAAWREGRAWVAERCGDADVIVAGDLNATADHYAGTGAPGFFSGRCRDAAAVAGGGAIGTWPTWLPSWLGAPIDHVLAGEAFVVRGYVVVTSADAAGSDHRPVIARLERR